MSDTLRVACVQVTSKTKIADNIALTDPMIREAAEKGAQLVVLPEVVNLVQRDRDAARAEMQLEANEPALAAYRALARELGIWIHVGSLAVWGDDGKKPVNRGYLLRPDGTIAAKYDKIHMFDVDLENNEIYRESDSFEPGDQAVLASTPWGGYGMTICYDMRFPDLYRSLASAGARILTAPASFTRPTGQAHWHTLLRSRAIENGCFMISAAQCGDHEDGRKTYGHSLIIDPWGEILADGGEESGVVIADLDLSRVEKVRGMVPSLKNGRPFSLPSPLPVADAG